MLSEPGIYAHLSDQELMERIKESDEQAFQQFMSRHWRLVCGMCRRVLWDPEEAKDIAQDAFLKLWTIRDEYNANKNAKSWVCRIASNLCIDLLRRRRREVIGLDTEVVDSREDTSPSPEDKSIKDDLWRVGLPCFKDLDEQELRVLIMIYLADSNPNRVSKALGLKYKEVTEIRRSALAKLRQCMEVSHHD